MPSAPHPAGLPVAHDPALAGCAGTALVTALPAPSAPADDLGTTSSASPVSSSAPAAPPDLVPAPAAPARPGGGDLPGRTDQSASGAALDAVGAGFCLHGPGPTLLEANATARDLLGLGLGPGDDAGAADLSGAPADPLAHPTLLALRTGEPVQGIVLGVHPGTPRARWVRLDAAVVAAGPEADRRVVTLLVDVTAQTERSRESAAAAERAARLMEPVADVICRLDDRGRFLDVTRSAATVLGYEPEDLFGRTLAGLAHVEGAELVRQALTDARTGGLGHAVVRCRRRDGELHWMDIEVRCVDGDGGRDPELHAVLRDVHASVLTERAREESEQRYRLLADNAADVVLVLDPQGRLRYASPSLHSRFGHRPEELIGVALTTLVHPHDVEQVEDLLAGLRGPAGTEHGERYLTHRLRHHGGWSWVETVWRPVCDPAGGLAEVHATTRDVSDRSRQELEGRALRGLDLRDPLTTAATGGLLRDRLAAALADPRRTGVAVMRVDLDRFRLLADARGHVATDRVLVLTVQRLREIAGADDAVARLGGDDFAVLCAGADHAQLERLAQKVSRALTGSVGGVGPVSVSIGVGTARPGDGVADVLNRAEAALSVVKLSGGCGWAVD